MPPVSGVLPDEGPPSDGLRVGRLPSGLAGDGLAGVRGPINHRSNAPGVSWRAAAPPPAGATAELLPAAAGAAAAPPPAPPPAPPAPPATGAAARYSLGKLTTNGSLRLLKNSLVVAQIN